MWTRDEMLETCQTFLDTSRRMAVTQELVGIAFVFAEHHPQTDEPIHEVGMFPMLGDKDDFARQVQFAVDVTGAAGVLIIVEAWMVLADKEEDLADMYPASGSLADHPDRIEAVTATLSLRDGSSVMWMGEITGSVEAPPRVIAEYEKQETETIKGRFASFFAPVED